MDSIEFQNDENEAVFVVAPEFFDSLDTLQTQLNLQSKADVLKYALTLMHVLCTERYDNGARLYLSYPQGGFREIKFWNQTKPSLAAVDGKLLEDK